ncbi:hypothetical protein IQ06DRAFT_94632 [Phaeosphaeriaceae sp. SRC1lsM3a]|nr:hypothetical protein IQ06DRAFT_94632 [Stagonospora sp. SRC1lsM3a]
MDQGWSERHRGPRGTLCTHTLHMRALLVLYLAALITLRKYFRRYKLIDKIRLALVTIFATFLFSSMIAAICMPPTTIEHDDGTKEKRSRTQRLSFIVPLFLVVVGFSTAPLFILYDPQRQNIKSGTREAHVGSLRGVVRRATDPRRSILPPFDTRAPAHISICILYYLFLSPLIAFGVQGLLSTLSVILVLTQKFSPPKDSEKFCGLQDEDENMWGFGQTLSIVMLLLPAMTAFQTYLQGRQDIREGFSRSKN